MLNFTGHKHIANPQRGVLFATYNWVLGKHMEEAATCLSTAGMCVSQCGKEA